MEDVLKKLNQMQSKLNRIDEEVIFQDFLKI